uniref:TATA-box binding protein associated factor 9b n=1 Tax=Saimiri boliviensis boliviensis TaxID=39432 RepID=A0A2K6V4K9_SAIBB
MKSGKMAPPKNVPRDALVMAQILKDMGITEYEPRVINQMLEFKPNVDADDVRLAIQCRIFLLNIERQKNQTPLPLIKPYAGPRLPPDRYCLTSANYRLKSLTKKGHNQGRLVPRLSVGAVSSKPTTPSIVTPPTVSVPNKVATPVSVTSQRFTVQIPPSQSTPVKSVPATTVVQNVLINPSMIGPKNIIITTNTNTTSEANPLKRKHEDDEDNDTM